MRRYATSKIALLLITLPWAVPVYADKWLPPKPETYESRRGAYRLTIFPAQPETHLTVMRTSGNSHAPPAPSIGAVHMSWSTTSVR